MDDMTVTVTITGYRVLDTTDPGAVVDSGTSYNGLSAVVDDVLRRGLDNCRVQVGVSLTPDATVAASWLDIMTPELVKAMGL